LSTPKCESLCSVFSIIWQQNLHQVFPASSFE